MSKQRFVVEQHIAPPMRRAITLVHESGIVVYVTQSVFDPGGNDQTTAKLVHVAKLIARAFDGH